MSKGIRTLLNKLTYKLMSRLTKDDIMEYLLSRGCARWTITTKDGTMECVGTYPDGEQT